MELSPSVQPRNSAIIWSLRALAGIALSLSLYLSWQAVTREELGGCGTASDCQYVLGSRWSNWLGVPVAMLGAANYLLLLFASFGAGPRVKPNRRRVAWAAIVGLASTAAAAAGYFIFLQATVLQAFCPWCLAVHLCAIVIAAAVILGLWHGAGGPASVGRRPVMAGVMLAIVAMAALIVGQVLRPGSYRVTALAHPLDLPRGQYPTIGPPDAPHVVFLLGDYTCPHCQLMHRYLARACKVYENQIAVVILPVPMNRKCNSAMQADVPRHRYACELNRLSLVVWRADPSVWSKMDQWLSDAGDLATPADARQYAESLLGPERLGRAEADPWPDQAIQGDVDIYIELGAGPVPKLLAGKDVIVQAEWEGAVFKALEKSLGVKRMDQQ